MLAHSSFGKVVALACVALVGGCGDRGVSSNGTAPKAGDGAAGPAAFEVGDDPWLAPWLGPVNFYMPDHRDPQLFERSPSTMEGAWVGVLERRGHAPAPVELRVSRGDGPTAADGGWTGESVWRSHECFGVLSLVARSGDPVDRLTFREDFPADADAKFCPSGAIIEIALPAGPDGDAGEISWSHTGIGDARTPAWKRALR
ncbi:hypothetical protein GC169_02085 [bacterium]|nr:hypothetical protein [bacterium]